jgi:hypothetical protein
VGLPLSNFDRAETLDKGHGRIEIRRLEATASLTAYLAPFWAGIAQVCRITRHRIIKGKESIEVAYAITSLPPDRADAARLLELSRAHWGIENKLHYVRDVTCREDACKTRTDNAPQALAALRNTALTIIRRLGFRPVEGFEHFAEHRNSAICAVKSGRTE